MDIGQLEAFVQVSAHRSFSKAAESLFLTQPSVTARIQALEKELDEELFERTGRGVRLTESGETFLAYAERILRDLREGRDALESLRDTEFGSLRLGTALTISTYVLPGVLKSFRTKYPGIELSVRTGRSEQVLDMVLADEVQVGIVRSLQHADIEAVHLYDDDVVLVANPAHPFAHSGPITIEEVARQPLIFFDKTSSYYTLTQSMFRQASLVPRVAMELDSLEATKKMVEEGLGIALLPAISVEREAELGILSIITVKDTPVMRRPVSIIYRRNRKQTRVVQAFIEEVTAMYKVPPPRVAPVGAGSL